MNRGEPFPGQEPWQCPMVLGWGRVGLIPPKRPAWCESRARPHARPPPAADCELEPAAAVRDCRSRLNLLRQPGTAAVGAAVALAAARLAAAEPSHPFGPLFADVSLTLPAGQGWEALGPLLGREVTTNSTLWRLSPLLARYEDPGVEHLRYDFLYPACGYVRYGGEWQLHFLQFLQFTGGRAQEDSEARRRTLFPFVFSQQSTNPARNYFALVPFWGTLQNRLFRDEVRFLLLPLYLRTRKRDVVTDNYLAPFFHLRRSPSVKGWQFWPLAGHEVKQITTRTNLADEPEVVPGHQKTFVAWPFFFHERLQLGTDNPKTNLYLPPAWFSSRSPQEDYRWILFFSHRTNRTAAGYREWSAPWPFIAWSDGPGRQVRRVFPLYGRGGKPGFRSDFVLWPLYVHRAARDTAFERDRWRFLYWAYSDLREVNPVTGAARRRRDLWPLFSWSRDLEGRERLQVLAPLEPLRPGNGAFERLYSPVWSLWRQQRDPVSGRHHASLLWNLWRREGEPGRTRTSCLFGAVRTEKTAAGRRWRWFGFPRPPAESRPANSPVPPGPNP